jgi:DNA-directed RNA polymerase subunit beta'
MEFFFCNGTYNKKEIINLIQWFLINYGTKKTSNLIDKLKILSLQYATKGGLSIGIEDLKIPKLKRYLLENTQKETKKNDKNFFLGKITTIQKFQEIINIWNTSNLNLMNELICNFRQTNILNPVYIAALSGARGNIAQVKQLVGMRGLMSDSTGEIIDLPIKSNFKEGLNITEYLISCYGARKGLIDTALKTSNSGYLTRKLVDVAQSIVIKKVDCATFQGILITPLIKEKKTFLTIKQRIIGRISATNVLNKKNKIIVSKGQDICIYLANKIIKKRHEKTKIYTRSPLTCQSKTSICQLCYGWNLTQGRLIEIGEAVGVIAAQSIGEPGTQLTMRTFHTGGVFYGNVSKKIYSPYEGILQYFINKKSKIIKSENGINSLFTVEDQNIYIKKNKYNTTKIKLPPYSKILIKPNSKIKKKEVVAEISNYEEIFKITEKNSNSNIKEVKTKIEGQTFFEKNKLWVMGGKIITFFSLVKTIKQRKNFYYNKSDSLSKKKIIIANNFIKSFYPIKRKILIKFEKNKKNIHNQIIKKTESLNKMQNFFIKEKKIIKRKEIITEEIKTLTEKKQCLIYTKQQKIIIQIKSKKYNIGELLKKSIKKKFFCGQVIMITKNKIVLRKGKPSLTPKLNLKITNNKFILKNNTLFFMQKKQSKTEDIVQGLPKIDELLEARTTKHLQPLLNNPKEKLKNIFNLYSKKYKNNIAVRKSVEQIQKYLLETIQLVYLTQNITISDKHLEIIIRQMTSKIIITDEGNTEFLVGEILNRINVEKINKKIKNKAKYEPIIEGITRASIETESFISSASFQETAKNLTKSATEEKIDWLGGLKENVIIGRLIEAGTGIKSLIS